MNTGLISLRYATALYDFAKQSNVVNEVYSDVKLLTTRLSEYKELNSILSNPVLKEKQKYDALMLTLGANVNSEFKKFLNLVLQNNREKYLKVISLRFLDLYSERNSFYTAKLTTAYELDAVTEQKIMAMVQEKVKGKIEIKKFIDPNIIGGFVIDMNNLRWDGSISSQFKRMKSNFATKNKKIVL